MRWRPGSGFYTDELPIGMLHKAHSIGRQVASLPQQVNDIQYELENFPYQVLRKSATACAAEVAAALGAGCTGTALNMLDMHDTPLGAQSYFAKIGAGAPFFAEAAETFGRSACEGICQPFTAAHFAALQIDGRWEDSGSWGSDFSRYYELSEIGLPLAYAASTAAITLLTPANCVEYTPDELRTILSGAVMMDGSTLEALEAIGLGELSGFRVAGRKDQDAIERQTAHPLNGAYAGYHRDNRPSFYAEPVYLFAAIAGGTEVLAEVIDFSDVVHGVSTGLYENHLGGRIAVFGYYPWRMIHTHAKTEQLKAICRWLSQDHLPAYVASYHKMALWCRRDASDNPALLLLNLSLDAAEEIDVCIRSDAAPMLAINMEGEAEHLLPTSSETGYAGYRIDRIAPWQALLLKRA